MPSPEAEFDILVLGDLNPDLVLRDPDPVPVFGDAEQLVEAASLELGSSAGICASAAARLGLRTALIAVVGADVLGRYALGELAARGVDVDSCVTDPSEATGVSVVLARPDDRAILTFPGTIARLRVAHVPPTLLERVRHLHVSSYFLLAQARSELPRLFEDARRRGITTSLDCNWDPSERWDGGLLELLEVTDVFLCNLEEALKITGEPNAHNSGQALARRAGAAVVKIGPDGAIAVAGTETAAVRAPAVDPIDTVGAGDSFDAGFLSQWINDEPLEQCVRVAVACGALSTRAAGGAGGQATLTEALALAKDLLLHG